MDKDVCKIVNIYIEIEHMDMDINIDLEIIMGMNVEAGINADMIMGISRNMDKIIEKLGMGWNEMECD